MMAMMNRIVAGAADDPAEIRMNQERRCQIDRGDRHVHHQQDDRAGDEMAQVLKIAKQLEFAV